MVAAAGQLVVMPLHRLLSTGAEGAPSLRVRQIALGALGAVIAGAALGVVVFDSA